MLRGNVFADLLSLLTIGCKMLEVGKSTVERNNVPAFQVEFREFIELMTVRLGHHQGLRDTG